FACTAAMAVPMPTVSDNCSGVAVLTQIVTVTEEEIYNQYGLPTGQLAYDTVVVRTIQPGASRFVSGIPFGQHFFRYIASDDCGNATTLYCPFEVVDNIEPVAVCDDQLNVSIGGGNIMPGQPAAARVFAEDVDEGSWDNCGPVDVAIFRDNFNAAANTCGSGASPTGSYVDFFCCDVGVTVSVTLVVTDQHGNQNTCWLSVTPEDKIRPFCEAPANVNVGCDDLPHGFDPADPAQLEGLFGMASGADNCGIASVQQVAANASLECRAGSITRVFRVADVHGNLSQNTCVQVINIQEVHNYEIFFPADTDYACGEEAAPAEVAYNEIGCDLLAVSSTDEQFSASGQECYKIFRTWKVINWCEYDGESSPLIIGRDEDCDGTPGNRNLWLLARENGTIFYDADQNELGGLPGPNACGISSRYYSTDNYTAASRPGFYQYTQIIKVYDDTAPAVSFVQASPFCSLNNTTCSASVVYPFAVTEDCTPGDLSIRVFLNAFNAGTFTELPASALSGGYPNYSISGTYPIGAHAFRVVVRDGCGNSAQAQLPFEVIDCKAPAPVCINGIAVELMPVDQNGDNLPDAGEGMAEIWASDFIASAITDCTGPVKYAINRAGEPNDPDQDGLALTCADLGTLVIEIWAYDGAGNGDFCETYLLVQDNQGICGSGAPSAAGAVHTRGQQPVENVTVSISGQGSTTAVTSAAGQYAFEGLQPGLDYTLTPQRDGDYLNGVSTFDLVLISKHILGIQPLASPYQLIAADVNNSRSITTLDMIQLRKLILSVDTEFSNNDSWRFVDASYVFPNPANPWLAPFPEGINLNNLPLSGVTAADFIAVKIGDVSGDAVASSLVGGIEERSTATFVLRAADASLRAGEEYSVVVSAPGLAGIEGYQATLALSSAAELLGIKGGVASEEHFGFAHASEGLITTSWNGEATEGVLFTLMIRATEDAQLSEILGVSSAIAKAEAYGKDGSFQDVAIEFSNGTAAAGFEVYQNQPNPFRGETVIGFDLPEAASATVTVSDITGKVLKVYHINGVAGYNAIAIDAGAFPAKGVLAYTVKTGSFSVARKMMVID
ncbi:T9SS type A sorting domain-containing protein, partial [Phaeodactylibacter luteus]